MKRVFRFALGGGCVLLGLMTTVSAQPLEDELLSAEAAFGAKARILDGKTIEVRFDVAPDYYLYRKRFKAEVAGKLIPATRIVFPAGKVKQDPTFGRVETYEGALTLKMRNVPAQGQGPAVLKITTQGCAAKAGVCYPPLVQTFRISGSSSNWLSPERGDDGSFAAKSSLKGLVQKP